MAEESPRSIEAIPRLVEELNRAHGLRFEVSGRCASGLQGGAWNLVDPAGRRAVLKRSPVAGGPDIRRVADAVAVIRSAGYPTPAWLASGTTSTGSWYWVQDHVPGRPATPLMRAVAGSPRGARRAEPALARPTAELLIEVLERQAGLDPVPDRNWADRVTAMALSDEDGSLRATVRGVGAAGLSLLASYDRLLAHAGPVELATRDMVHGDFNSCNILLRGGRVSGVIDVQDMGSGSRVMDYACLLREAYVEDYGDTVIRPIRRAGEAAAGWAALVRCVAAAAFFIVGFKLRHDPASLAAVLARLHRLAGDLSRPG